MYVCMHACMDVCICMYACIHAFPKNMDVLGRFFCFLKTVIKNPSAFRICKYW